MTAPGLNVVWLCNCGSHAEVNATTRVVAQHETPEHDFCRMSSCVVSYESLRVYGLPGICGDARDGLRCLLPRDHDGLHRDHKTMPGLVWGNA